MRILRWTIIVILAGLAVELSAWALWHLRVERLIAAIDAEPAPAALPATTLPDPVTRFFAAAISPNRTAVRAVTLDTAGDFLMAPGPKGWRPFQAHQRFNAITPGFVWDARIAMAPMLQVFVRDAYFHGRGELVARVLGVYAVANESGSGDLADGELMRYLAEMVWFPSALRPGSGVTWTGIDEHRATAHLADRGHSVSLQFTFNDTNDITEVFAPARMRTVKGGSQPTPWAVRCWDHQERSGFRIPISCVAEWRLTDGPQVYWRGRVTHVTFVP